MASSSVGPALPRFRCSLTLLVAALAACSDSTGPTTPTPVHVRVIVSSNRLFVGETANAQAEVLDAAGVPITDAAVTWTSSRHEVVSISEAGLMTALSRGETVIRASIQGISGEAAVTVQRENAPFSRLLEGEIETSVNPSGIAPLTALVSFRTTEPAVASFTVLGSSEGETVRRVGTEAVDQHTLPILGLYPGTENRVEIRLETDALTALHEVRLTTEALPDFFPTVTVNVAHPASMEPGWTLSSLSIGNAGVFEGFPIMFDGEGDIRWYLDLSYLGGMVFAVEPLANGNLITGFDTLLYEFDMFGNVVDSWHTPGYTYHHEVIEKGPGGNLIVAVDKHGLPSVEDHIIEVDRETGAIVREWDLRQILQVERKTFLDAPEDWFHMNSVWYDERDGSLVVSGRNQTAVVKISADGELVWILGPHRGWSEPWSDLLLTAVDQSGIAFAEGVLLGDVEPGSQFRWPWGQHAAMYLPNGNLFIFDNGFLRTWSGLAPGFSRGVEYEVDEERMTIRQVWQYGEERGLPYYSAIISDVDHLPQTGNRLIMPGLVQQNTKALVTEVTYPGGDVVFDAEIAFKRALGSGAGWGQFDLVYRSERVALYPNP